MGEPKNQMLGTMVPPLMQLSVNPAEYWNNIKGIFSDCTADMSQKKLIFKISVDSNFTLSSYAWLGLKKIKVCWPFWPEIWEGR